MKLRSSGSPGEHEVEILAHDGTNLRARVDGREVTTTIQQHGQGGATMFIETRRFQVASARRKDGAVVTIGPRCFEFTRVEEGSRRGFHGLAAPEIVAPMPGKVLRVMVKEGETVAAGQPLVVMEAMKMETSLAAESDAIVKRIAVTAGQMVDHGAVLIELSPPPKQ